MASKAVAVNEPAPVPALAPTPAIELTAEDIALPRIYLGQYMSKAVKDQLVKPGSIYAATGADDPDPHVLSTGADPVRVHILALHKGKSYSDGGELQLFDYNDPSAPPDAWTTYNYTCYLPEGEDGMPYKWLLTRTGRNTARQINTVIKKNEAAGPPWINAFDLTTQKRENAKGEYYVARVSVVAAEDDHVKAAEELAAMIAGSSADYGSTGDEPSI